MLAVALAIGQATTVPSNLHADFLKRLVAAAIERTHHSVRYDPAYVRIPYPGGDVPAGTGVCTDEVIRAYRAVGVDLQKEVHEDITHNFSAYQHFTRSRAAAPDANIDHRRVPNLMVFFSRHGEVLKISERAEDYAPGDLVTWDLGENVPHVGIVVGPEIGGERALYDCPQRRTGPPNGRCLVQLENHRALPLLRTTVLSCKMRFLGESISHGERQ